MRNHGAVPQLSWDTHRIEVGGGGKGSDSASHLRPFSIGMDELAAMPTEQFPCLVTCAGNRRKEQNMIKKSIGFSWGPCGTAFHSSTSQLNLSTFCGMRWVGFQ